MEERERRSSIKTCRICKSDLKEPYIKCAECTHPIFLQCLSCFAKGLCKGKHENDHSYEIVKNNFCIWADHWTAADELKLLEGIDDCGLGNWLDVGKCLRKPARECESHFMKYYVEQPQPPLAVPGDLDCFGQRLNSYPLPQIPYRVSDDPPRPQLYSTKHAEMAGYYAARGDFITEYNNFAEMNLKDVEFVDDEDDLDRQLKLVKVDIYNNQLRERSRRKRLLRRFGMIDVQKAAAFWMQRYEGTVGPDILKLLRPVMRCMEPEEFECLLESLHYEMELQQKIAALQEYRKCGLSLFHSAKLYHSLKQKRDEERRCRMFVGEVMTHVKYEGAGVSWSSTPASDSMVQSMPSRRSAPPLDVTGLPGYDKLSAKERELCSNVRLVPDAFLEFKALLVNENLRNGHLKLAQARQLIKIDVNKTRKLYDFLIQEGCVSK